MAKYFKDEKTHYKETNENKPVSRKAFPKEVSKGDFVERFDEAKGKNVVKQIAQKIEFPNGAIMLEIVEVENYGT
jgi:hypothetical protein